MTHGLYFSLAYTYARAINDEQDALVAGQPATVQNSHSPSSERGNSVTDQRQRFVFSWVYEPRAANDGISRKLYSRKGFKVQLLAESFNLFNRLNQRFQLTDNGAVS